MERQECDRSTRLYPKTNSIFPAEFEIQKINDPARPSKGKPPEIKKRFAAALKATSTYLKRQIGPAYAGLQGLAPPSMQTLGFRIGIRYVVLV
jgi:hypothetical protein